MAKKQTRRSRLQTASLEDLQLEISRREQQGGKLITKWEKLSAELQHVEAQLAEIGLEPGSSPKPRSGRGRPGRKRPRNDMNLTDALAKVLKSKTLGVSEAAEAVQKAGYKTSAANFRTIVNQALLRDERFKKVSRGKYTAK